MKERVCLLALLGVALLAQDKTAVAEGIVDAPSDEIWRVFSTAEGYKKLGVAQAEMDFRPGGLIRTHYDPKGQLGDDGTIVSEILTYDPGRVVTTRIARPPKRFPFMTAFKSVWTVVTLRDAGYGRTHVRCAMVGFDGTAESQAMRAFFERGNAAVIKQLQSEYGKAGAAAPSKLEAFAPLIGRDWTASMSRGNLTDTQRFEWVYGKQFVRNTHAVKTAKGEVVYDGETIYAWDARAGRIVWWYWNASGGYLEGTATPGAEGSIQAEGQNHGGTNQLDRTRSTIRVTGDGWTFTPSYEKDGVWHSEAVRAYR